MTDVVLVTDQGLGLLSLGLSILNVAVILLFALSLRARLRAERLERIAMGREHGVTGSVALLMFAALAVVTSIGPASGGGDEVVVVVVQVVALSIRLGITVVMLAWLALSLQRRLPPETAQRLDRIIRTDQTRHPKGR